MLKIHFVKNPNSNAGDTVNKNKMFFKIYKQIGCIQHPLLLIPVAQYGTEMKI
jgi:hypothetical protein